MSLRVWLVRFSVLFRKKQLEQDLDQDIQEHLEMAVEENLSRGMSPREAREAARRSFGAIEPMKEELRDRRGIPFFEAVARETRFAFRSLWRTPGFTVLTTLTLAIAIGANAAIFSAVNTLLFNPAGVSEPRRVVVVRSHYDKLNLKGLVISLDNFNAVNESREIFSATAVAKTGSLTYTGGASPQRLAALRVSSQWFDVLGTRPERGRIFTAAEAQPGNDQVAILTHASWQRVFGGDPAILGKTIELDLRHYKIVGVMGPAYAAAINELGGTTGEPQDLLVPVGTRAENARALYTEAYLGVARLQSGIALAQAQTFMGALTNRGLQDPLIGSRRKGNGWGLSVVPYTEFAGGDLKTPILILWGAVGFVLLIACSNIAGLTLARASTRSREFAVRATLGATRWHLMRQMFAESLILSFSGSLLGLCIGYSFIRGVEILGPETVVGGLSISFDLPMLLFTAAAALVSAALFGFAPIKQLGHLSSEALKQGGRSQTAGLRHLRLRSVLVIAEIALALVLSIGCGLLIRSLSRLQQVDVGFRPEGVMTAAVALPEARYKEPSQQLAFFRDTISQMSARPDVLSAAAAYPMPFSFGSEQFPFQIVGRPVHPNEPVPVASLRWVTPGFFTTLRIPLKSGRAFTGQDSTITEPVAIIDEALAQQYWPDEDPVGRQIVQGDFTARIIGVVGHTRQANLERRAESGVLYYHFYQRPVAFGYLIVQSAATSHGVWSIQEVVTGIDPLQAIYDSKSMEDRIAATLAGRRFTIALLGLFSLTAVFLAALGLYGVINYGVTRRIPEIGIRITLGAQRSQVVSLIVGQGMRLTLIGMVLGLCAAFEIARALPNQLFGVSAFDPVTFIGMGTVVMAVALLASYVPARRAMTLDPVEACRND